MQAWINSASSLIGYIRQQVQMLSISITYVDRHLYLFFDTQRLKTEVFHNQGKLGLFKFLI